MKKLSILLLCLFLWASSEAQWYYLNLPSISQKAEVMQRIGVTDIRVVYHSPAVKGRNIFGDVVPYGQVWRAGANVNTTVSFAHDVTVEGQKLAAGTYGLHMIPERDEWTVIFSNNNKAWGSYGYKKEEDALRVKVKPLQHEPTEWLTYTFTGKAEESATLSLLWDKINVPVKIGVDVTNTALADVRKQLQANLSSKYEAWYEAAAFTLQEGVAYEEGLKWINTADQMNPKNFSVLSLKAQLLEKTGKGTEAKEIMNTALNYANENDLNAYGYQLLGSGKTGEAITVFRKNVKANPESWNVYDSLAEALAISGNKKEAKDQYAMALKKAPADQKERIQKAIDGLK